MCSSKNTKILPKPDNYLENLKFTEKEINNQCIAVSKRQVKDKINQANKMLDVLKDNGCLVVWLTDFKILRTNNAVVKEILSAVHAGQFQGNLIESVNNIEQRLEELEAPTQSNRSKMIKLVEGRLDDYAVVRVVCPVSDCNSRPFETKQNVHEHYRRYFHKQQKGFQCNRCGKTFDYASGRTVHIRAVHEHVRFPCPLCRCSYTALHRLREHISELLLTHY